MRLLQNLRHLACFLGSSPRPTVRPRSRPLVLEALEDRLLMSVTARFGTAEGQPAGQLTVTGDGASDTISLFAESQQIKVRVNGTLIRGVPDASVSAIQVNAGGGADTVRIASSLPASIISLTADGGDDNYVDTLVAHEPVSTIWARDYTITATTVTRHATVPITYQRIQSLILDAFSNDNTINVESVSAPLTINAGGGNDVINLCPTGRFLDALGGGITVRGDGNSDTLHLFDQNNPYGDSFTVGDNGIYRDFFGGVTWDTGMENVVLHAGGGNNTFQMMTSVSVPLRIEDGGGADTLDYSFWLTAVTVNLETGTATHLGGGFSGIENALGGEGNDELTGNGANNVLVGHGGNDILNGGGGRDILIGGRGADQLRGGPGDDILIDGFTTYDRKRQEVPGPDTVTTNGPNVEALNALMAEWQSDDPYDTRIYYLRNGGGANGQFVLNSTTVTNDDDPDGLTGGDNRDWFFSKVKPRYYFGPAYAGWDTTDRWEFDYPYGTYERVW